jgi:thiamine-monophosphate kinase
MEFEFIRWLGKRIGAHPALAIGPGDDAAVLRLAEGAGSVLSVDLLTEGVDFVLGEVSPRRVGRKALAVNLSDLAAMAARPLAAVVALALPRAGALELAKELYEGLLPLAERYNLAIAGGDTNTWDGPLVVSVTVVGETTKNGPVLRSGAKPGDWIVVSGRFGGSRLGHHLDFEPRVDEALWLASRYPVHALIDCSDGLSLDLARVAEASGCGAVVEMSKIPVADAAAAWAAQGGDGSTALEHALCDGEDFELIAAIPPEAAAELVAREPLDCGLTCIGHFVSDGGLWQVDAARKKSPLAARGYEH